MKIYTLKHLCVLLFCTIFIVQNIPAQKNTKISLFQDQWYCDERLKMNLLVGSVIEIVPYKKTNGNEEMSAFTQNNKKYKTSNIVKIKLTDLVTGEKSSETLDFFSAGSENNTAIKFKKGEKYLFEGSVFRTDSSKKVSTEYRFIKPGSFIKSYKNAEADITFLRTAKKHNLYTDVLGAEVKDVRIAPVLSGKRLNIVKPAFDVKKLKTSETVKVMVLVDESGKVIKARAFCFINQNLASSSEKAALASSYSPTIVAGKRVKVVDILIYNFIAE